MSMFDNLTPEQQQAVMRNVGQRVGGARDMSTLATKLRGNDRATAQAMQYIGMEVPQNMHEGEGDPIFDVFQILDGYADNTASPMQAQQMAQAQQSGANSGGQGGNVPVPPTKPDQQSPETMPAMVDDGGGLSDWMTGAALVAGGAAGIYALKRAYDKYKAGSATPEEIEAVNRAAQQGVDLNALDTIDSQGRAMVPSNGNQPAVIDGDYSVVDPQRALPAPEQRGVSGPQTQQLPGQQMQQLMDMRAPISMPDQSSGPVINLPDGTPQNMNLQALMAERASNYSIPNVDIGMTPQTDMGQRPVLNLLQNAKPRVRIKP